MEPLTLSRLDHERGWAHEQYIRIGRVKAHNPAQRAFNLIADYFGDPDRNHRVGLTVQYNRLVNHLSDENIGCILHGASTVSILNPVVSTYTTADGTEIALTVQSICQRLLDEFIPIDLLSELCIAAAGAALNDYTMPPPPQKSQRRAV